MQYRSFEYSPKFAITAQDYREGTRKSTQRQFFRHALRLVPTLPYQSFLHICLFYLLKGWRIPDLPCRKFGYCSGLCWKRNVGYAVASWVTYKFFIQSTLSSEEHMHDIGLFTIKLVVMKLHRSFVGYPP